MVFQYLEQRGNCAQASPYLPLSRARRRYACSVPEHYPHRPFR